MCDGGPFVSQRGLLSLRSFMLCHNLKVMRRLHLKIHRISYSLISCRSMFRLSR